MPITKEKKYVGDMIGGGLLIVESRIVARTLLEGLPEKEWKLLFKEKNILQKRSVNSAIRNANTVKKRLLPLGGEFIHALINAPERVYIQFLMLAVLINSPIVVDFMLKALAETKRTYKTELPADAWDSFVADKIRALPELVSFSESTLNKIGTNIIRTLVESGYLDSNRKRNLQPVYLLPEIKEWLIKLQRVDLEPVMECTL